MKIIILVEGKTEQAFKAKLLEYLKQEFVAKGHLAKMPNLAFRPCDGGVPTGDRLKRVVANHLTGKAAADHVIWLTDVYVDKRNPGKGLWLTAEEARARAREWVGEETRFHPHTALHDFEAWLLPYWSRIREHAKSNMRPPSGDPEKVNHTNPPSARINEAYLKGECKRRYAKTKDPQAILRGQDLNVAIRACSELRSFVVTILKLSGLSDSVLEEAGLVPKARG